MLLNIFDSVCYFAQTVTSSRQHSRDEDDEGQSQSASNEGLQRVHRLLLDRRLTGGRNRQWISTNI